MHTDEQFEQFEDAITNLSKMATVDDIPILCVGFDDSTEEEEVMFGLLHLIESFQGEQAIELTIQGILKMTQYGKRWSKLIIKRILNNDSTKEKYRLVFTELDSSSKNELVGLMNEIKSDYPEIFGQIINAIETTELRP